MHVLFLVFAFVLALGDARGQKHPAALAAHSRRDVELPQHRHGRRAQPGLLAQFAGGELGRLEICLVGRGALGKLPAPQAQRVAELLDQVEPVAVLRAITSAYVGLSTTA